MVTNTGSYDLFDALYPDYKCEKPVRLIEFFGGIGSQAKALERLGIDFETWKLVEIDRFAVESYNAIHDTVFTTSDITQLHGSDMSVVSPDVYDYILTWSFPCIRRGQIINVKGKPFCKIEDVKAGDLVYTHTGEFKKVLWAGCTGIKRIYKVNVCHKLYQAECTDNHKFLCTKGVDAGDEFIACKDLTSEYFIKTEEEIEPGRNFSMEDAWQDKEEYMDGTKAVDIYQPGDAIQKDGFWWVRVRSVTDLGVEDEVYDLTVEDNHTFSVLGLFVHNCQSLSVAGLRKGMQEGSGTTSSLIWEVKRILNEMNDLKESGEKTDKGESYGLPKILLMENVPQVIDAKNVRDLNKMRDFLESLGYSNHLAILKGNDYGVPQARHRAFMVSILGDEENPVYAYQFPLPCGCKWSMLDCLYDDFEGRQYVRDSVSHRVAEEGAAFNRNTSVKLNEIKLCGRLNAHQAGGVFDPLGVSPTLTAGGASAVNVLWRSETDKDDSDDWDNPIWFGSAPESDVTVIEDPDEVVDYFFNADDEEPEYDKEPDYDWEPVIRDHVEYSVRTLSSKESFQIMDFDAGDHRKAALVTSNHQMHKQAGNSIVVNCIVALLGQFFKGRENVYREIAELPPKDRAGYKKEF